MGFFFEIAFLDASLEGRGHCRILQIGFFGALSDVLRGVSFIFKARQDLLDFRVDFVYVFDSRVELPAILLVRFD